MRLQANGANPYVYLFTYFLLFAMVIKADGFTLDYFIGAVEEMQSW
jgi:exportin-2 (importin alpha re-exporter)